MKKFLIVVLVLIVLVVGAVAALPFLIPVEQYKAQITERTRDATGRDLLINGDIGFEFWPNVALTAGDVTFSNAPGGKAPQMATLDALVLSVKLMPLLSGSLQIDSFVLRKPVINLEVDEKGKANWDMKKGGEAAAASGGGGTGFLTDVKLGDVRLEDGKVSYANAQTGQAFEASAIDMTVSLADLNSPLKAVGALTWNGKKIDLDLETGNLAKMLEGTPTNVAAKLASEPVSLGYQGSVTLAEAMMRWPNFGGIGALTLGSRTSGAQRSEMEISSKLLGFPPVGGSADSWSLSGVPFTQVRTVCR